MRLESVLLAVGIAAAAFTLISLARRYACRRIQLAGAATKLLLFVPMAAWLGCRVLTLPPTVELALGKLAFMALVVQLAFWGAALIGHVIDVYAARHATDDGGRVTTLRAVSFLAKLVLLTMLFLWGLDNLGVNITTLVAGLGVGGIAIALAVQNVLGDLFASLSIVLDKPFVIGDFIVAGRDMGTIERIGLKTTRVRSLSGEQLIFPNNDLLKSRIRNFKRMQERRVEFRVNVPYDVETAVLRRLPDVVRRAVESEKKTRFERAHLKELAEKALIFEFVYWVREPDQELYMDIQQRLNLQVLGFFAENAIVYPARLLEPAFEEESPRRRQSTPRFS